MRVPLYSVQDLAVGKLSLMARPRGGDWLLDEIKFLREVGVDVLVSLLTLGEVGDLELQNEAEYCEQQGILYLAFPIEDRSVPPFSSGTFVFLKQLHDHVAAGKHVVVHCRQALGRAVLIVASLLVLNGMPPSQAFEVLSVARGYPVPETEEQQTWVAAFFFKFTSLSG